MNEKVLETIKRAVNTSFVAPVEPPKNAVKRNSGEGWILWQANEKSFISVLGYGVYLIKI